MDIFEEGIRNKVRFNYRGLTTMEDLYDLPVVQTVRGEKVYPINDIYNGLLREKQEQSTVNLFNVQTDTDKLLDLKLAIVKHVAEVKKAEEKEKRDAQANKRLKAKLLSVKASKQDKKLEEMTEEQLDAMLAELD